MAFNPTGPSEYIGKQIILDSDRILFNAREDNMLFSNKGFSFSTNGEFHFNTSDNTGNKFVVNAPKIQLGVDNGGTTTNNPAVKGNELESLLTEILDLIDQLYKVDLLLLNPIAPLVGPCAPDAAFSGKTQASQLKIEGLKQRLKDFKSNKVFLT